jgi:ribosomal protein L40E
VVISDFGLTELQDLLGVQLKQAASPFLSPERVAGSPADASADVYSLAAILYSMLAKRPPQVVKGEVLPPSRFNPDVPPAMDAVVVKALAQDPAQRYPDVKSFLAAFGAVTLVPAAAKAEPVAADSGCPRCGAQNQSGKFCRKCGARLTRPKERVPERARSLLDEPIQVTEVTMGNMRIEVGSGVDVRDTVIAQPMAVVAGESLAEFPEPLEVPRIDLQRLWPTVDGQAMITMPEPPAMPTIDWAEIAPPMPDVPTMEDIPVSSEGD